MTVGDKIRLPKHARPQFVHKTVAWERWKGSLLIVEPTNIKIDLLNLPNTCNLPEITYLFILFLPQAYELSTLTGTQVMLLVASETGHVYTFATRKLQPMITSDSGKRLIQTCLNSPDPPQTSEQRMAATGFEETELTYNVVDDDMKVRQLAYQSAQYPLEHHPGLAPSPLQQYHQHPPCPSPLPLGSLGQPYSHPHLTHPHMSHHPQR